MTERGHRTARAAAALLALVVAVGVALVPATPAEAADWSRLSPAQSPPPTSNGAMAVFPALSAVVLFGGFHSDPSPRLTDETWLWRGGTWTRAVTPTAPSPRALSHLAYDAASQRLLLFGGMTLGQGGAQVAHGDTWSFDGSTWAQLRPSTSPPPRYAGVMAGDPATGPVLLFGGRDPGRRATYSDTWNWTGTTWVERHPVHRPTARSYAHLAADAARRQVVLYGGVDRRLQSALGGTFTWDGSDWSLRSTAGSPPATWQGVMAYDPSSRVTVLLCGVPPARGAPGSARTTRQTWSWDGSTWTQEASLSGYGRYGAGAAYDAGSRSVLVFGGGIVPPAGGGYVTDQTWAFR